MTFPRSEEREVQVQMEEAKKVDFRSKLSAEERKGRQQEEPKAKTKTKQKDDALSSARPNTQNSTASSTFATSSFSPLTCTELFVTSVVVGNPPKPFTPSSPTADSSLQTQKSHYTSNILPSSSPSSISSLSQPILCVILRKIRLDNAGVFASSSVSATRDVFEPQSILLNNAAYVASQGIRVGEEKEGKEGKGEKKDEKRSANEFVSDKDEKGSLCLTDKCIDNEKDEEEEEEEEEEEDGFDKDIRKAQKERGAKEKMKTTKEKNKPQETKESAPHAKQKAFPKRHIAGMRNNPSQHIVNYHIIYPWRQQQQGQWHATKIHLSRLSISSITAANVCVADKTDSHEGSIARTNDEDEDGLSSPVTFFSSLLRLLNGEADLHADPLEER
ncbi:uncharacterized protein MONOS_13833 [Monocercomonoides exilis]|uniref:uncharacterized protein n=1 Tax=Monocercomonoides exilis TaxID=2049356 RepID=UPI00355A1503|nr:hypothetical protein MONOS_13833 [Monocercomonoides exilis]|eukprot:MONOS_13833.1-p1 / transcript=MONOS_13833.1 / gene=MONOS_13833 / organism=Monocercomonoides_exilis_PA203 / gene_product=unspecified product / transcript_product=unspecified product / location=Mono_scaffold00891:347-2154(+) / protein_length=388 / sequence_SO=supercontig / SO=protein_coding / is_pseudo=false